LATLADYMHWLESEGGHCQKGIQADDDIGMVPVIKLVAANGRYVIHAGDDQSETLSLMTIEYFDRRLQVISPFRSVPRA
jgi:hypothetical protein